MGAQVRHGNEDTFREMLRVKRSVTLQFSQKHVNATDVASALASGDGPAGKRARLSSDMEALERRMMDQTMEMLAEKPSTSRGGDVVASSAEQVFRV